MNIFESSVKRLLEDDFNSGGPGDQDPLEDEEPDEPDSFEDDVEEGDDPADMSLSEVIEEYMQRKRWWHFGGSSGIRNLEELLRDMGQGSQGGTLGYLKGFLIDNPDAIDNMVEWIGKSNDEEWKLSLLDAMH